jgi:hypothetical protein
MKQGLEKYQAMMRQQNGAGAPGVYGASTGGAADTHALATSLGAQPASFQPGSTAANAVPSAVVQP